MRAAVSERGWRAAASEDAALLRRFAKDRALASAVADATLRPKGRLRPLHAALFLKKPIDVVEALLDCGADLDTAAGDAAARTDDSDDDDETTTRGGSSKGRPGPAEVERPTPLICATAGRNFAGVNLLLRYGAEPSLAANSGFTPLMAGCVRGCPARDPHSPSLPTPPRACQSAIGCMTLLRKQGARVDDQCGETLSHYTALHFAAARGSAKAVNYLIRQSADLELEDRTGATPFFLAVVSNQAEAAQLLADAGSEIDAPANIGETALWAAAHAGNKEMCTLCIECGADFDQRSRNAWTPLMAAALQGHEKIVKALSKLGAQATCREFTAVDAARFGGHVLLARWLEQQAAEDGEE